jgi:hypothetical protein
MLIELCTVKYATFDSLMNGIDDILKTSSTCEKTIIWIMFQNFKIKTLTKENI